MDQDFEGKLRIIKETNTYSGKEVFLIEQCFWSYKTREYYWSVQEERFSLHKALEQVEKLKEERAPTKRETVWEE